MGRRSFVTDPLAPHSVAECEELRCQFNKVVELLYIKVQPNIVHLPSLIMLELCHTESKQILNALCLCVVLLFHFAPTC